MSFGQSFAPDSLLPFFNSAAPVAAVSLAVALAGQRRWQAIAFGAIAGPMTMGGYFATSAVRGFGVSAPWLMFWCTAGVAIGAVLGGAAWALGASKTERQAEAVSSAAATPSVLWWRGLAAAAWPGIAIGEATHGIVRIADSTPVGYWWAEIAVGISVAVATCLWRARSRLSATVAALGTVAVAAGLFLTYGAL
jgi:hypothetical protein